jgi:hypothetical protein
MDQVRRLNAFATGGLTPDRVVLDLPPGRAGPPAREGKGADRIEGAAQRLS